MIEVQIAKDKLDAEGHDALVGIRLIGSLKQAGIPVIGTSFSMRGITHGTLTYSNTSDLDGPVHRFVWRENDQDHALDKQVKGLKSKLPNGAIVIKTGKHAEDDEL